MKERGIVGPERKKQPITLYLFRKWLERKKRGIKEKIDGNSGSV